jgi:hypothetical protein
VRSNQTHIVRRKPEKSFHQKRVWFFTMFFGALAVLLVVGLLLLFNRSPLSGH